MKHVRATFLFVVACMACTSTAVARGGGHSAGGHSSVGHSSPSGGHSSSSSGHTSSGGGHISSSVGHSSSSGGSHSIRRYVKKSGTFVAPSHATNPNQSKLDNWSTRGNVNPHTGKVGTKDPATGK